MNWDQIEGKWSQVKGELRQRWGNLTDDDLEIIAGSKDKFLGRLQERYGIAKEDAQAQLDDWLKKASPSTDQRARSKSARSE